MTRHHLCRASSFGGGVLVGLDLALYNTAVMRTTATTATLFGNSAPIFVGVGTWILSDENRRRNFWTGLMLAMGGAAVVMVANAGGHGAAGDLPARLHVDWCRRLFCASTSWRPSTSAKRWTR